MSAKVVGVCVCLERKANREEWKIEVFKQLQLKRQQSKKKEERRR